MKTLVVFVGPAGAGKSSLVGAYAKWLEECEGLTSYKVNLDPAAEYVPYRPDFDVRRIVSAREVALKYGLGPNGALVKSIEILTERIDEVVKEIDAANADFVLIDTPGQMEVFVFRDLAPKLMQSLKRLSNRLVVLFMVDASLVRSAEDYAFLAIMSTALQVRLDVDVVPVLNKIDLAPDLSIVGDVVSDVESVVEKLKEKGTYGEMLVQVLNAIWSYSKAARVPRVSAATGEGMEELHRIVHEVTCACGDLT